MEQLINIHKNQYVGARWMYMTYVWYRVLANKRMIDSRQNSKDFETYALFYANCLFSTISCKIQH